MPSVLSCHAAHACSVSYRCRRVCYPCHTSKVHRRWRLKCSSKDEEPQEGSSDMQQPSAAAEEDTTPEQEFEDPRLPRKGKRVRKAESTDAIATFLTRRFGLAGGLAWLGLLTVGVLGEQIKTRLEVARESNNSVDVQDAAEVTTASGLRYTDIRRGGGETVPQRGYLLAIDLRIEDADGKLLFDSGSRQLAFFYRARPLQAPLCVGLEEGIASMRAGSVRRLLIPAQLGVPPGTRFPGGEVAPNGQELTYTIKLDRVSVPPS